MNIAFAADINVLEFLEELYRTSEGETREQVGAVLDHIDGLEVDVDNLTSQLEEAEAIIENLEAERDSLLAQVDELEELVAEQEADG